MDFIVHLWTWVFINFYASVQHHKNKTCFRGSDFILMETSEIFYLYHKYMSVYVIIRPHIQIFVFVFYVAIKRKDEKHCYII